MSERLKKHLNKLAETSSFAGLLSSQWAFDERLLSEALQHVSRVFSHYSRHDQSHSIEILKNIENVLGNKNIERLTATDTWLILEAAYWHDIGMLILHTEVSELFENSQFVDFLNTLSCHPSDDFYSTISAIRNKQNDYFAMDKKLPAKIDELYQIIASFYRPQHAKRAASIIEKPDTFNIKSPRTSLIKPRLWNILSQVCVAHGSHFSELLSLLKHRENTDGPELCHPRFVAALLRLGDLLDLDNGRFSDVLARLAGSASFIQKAHEDKHGSISHFLVTPKLIEVTAATETDAGYAEAAKWMKWLKDELTELTMKWLEIAPEDWDSPLPSLGQVQISMDNGHEVFKNDAIPTISLDMDAAMELFQGAGIYDTKWQAIRELLQNAVDATQIRIWRSNGIDAETSQPLNVTYQQYLDFAKQYPVDFILEECAKSDNGRNGETKIRVTIKDRGIGISKSDFSQMLQIGNTTSDAKKTLIEKMPAFMRPSGAFGLGLMSAFGLGATEVKFTSMSHITGEAYEYTISSPTGGNMRICSMKKTDTLKFEFYSTKLELEISVADVPSTIENSTHIEMVSKYLNVSNPLNDYDFVSDARLLPDVYHILYEALLFQKNSIVPVRISYMNKNNKTAKSSPVGKNEAVSDVLPCFLDDENINITGIEFSVEQERSRQQVMFKNQEIGKFPNDEAGKLHFLGATFNILGKSAKDVLSIDRNKLRDKFRTEFLNNLPTLMLKALPKFIDTLPENQLIAASAFYHFYTDSADKLHDRLKNRWQDIELGKLPNDTAITVKQLIKSDEIKIEEYIPLGLGKHNKTTIILGEKHFSLPSTHERLLSLLLNELQKPKYGYHFVQGEKEEEGIDSIQHVTLQKRYANPVSDMWMKNFLVEHLKSNYHFVVGGRVYFPVLSEYDKLATSPPSQYRYLAVPKHYHGPCFILPFFFDHQQHKVSTQHFNELVEFVAKYSDKNVSSSEIKETYNNFINLDKR